MDEPIIYKGIELRDITRTPIKWEWKALMYPTPTFEMAVDDFQKHHPDENPKICYKVGKVFYIPIKEKLNEDKTYS